MPRNSISPTETLTVDGHAAGEVVRTHPAFGLIGASRTQGTATLFGSPIKHHGFVSIKISMADEHIHLHRSWHFPKGEIVEVWLSESQWATFVSTMNVGSGVPCTISHAPDTRSLSRPGIEDDRSWQEHQTAYIQRKVREDLAKITESVRALERLADAPTIKKAEFRAALAGLAQVIGQAPTNWKFAADSVTEHTEHLIEAAKAEVTAYVTRMAMQFPALESVAPELPQIEQRKEGDAS